MLTIIDNRSPESHLRHSDQKGLFISVTWKLKFELAYTVKGGKFCEKPKDSPIGIKKSI